MRYFAGLDVSLEETAICIVDEAGGIVREARVASEPDALVAFFDAFDHGAGWPRGMFADGLAASRCDRGGDRGDLH